MQNDLQSLDVTQLTPAQRMELAQMLLESVHVELYEPPLTPEWSATLDRRLAELKSGAVRGISRDELKRALARPA